MKYFVVLLAVGVAFSFLGAPIQPLLAAAIIVGVILALALRGISENFASGVVLQTRRPIKIGDEIECNGIAGSVKELNGRSVVIRTLDGRTIHIPNSLLLQQPLINHSEAGARRSEVEVRVMLAPDGLDDFTDALTTTLQTVDGVHSREHARILFTRISEDRTTLTLQFWHHPTAGTVVGSRVVRAVGELMRERSLTGTAGAGTSAAPLTPPPAV
ncbi:mechanosensitive ion channel family protein [Leifsonia poae]|uniref:mechanosensitive ion channel family protein n=1 Tax=Leifsonia poae TaxID=110933 RepID=UPI001CBC8D3F|nr:mechanosensitive ion channel domain-containing protein [Leifsonia poae]